MKKIVLLSALLLSVFIGFAQRGTGPASQHGAGGGQHGYSHPMQGPAVMTPYDFAMARDAIARQTFDDDKLRVAKQVARGNLMNAMQVREVMSLFTFDGAKVDFAKFAYDKVVDRQNYYVVNDAFTFSSSVNDLDRFIRNSAMAGGNTWTSSHGGVNGGGHGSGQGGGYGSGQGGGYGQNGYYGGGNTVNASGAGNGVSYHGQVNTVPVVPACGLCAGHHAMNMICEREFADIGRAVCSRTFDSEKLIVAKQAVGCKLIGADQVRRLMGHFTFESSKLDFAKWAYSHCLDAGNYYLVNDAFTFSSSVRELDMFIRRC